MSLTEEEEEDELKQRPHRFRAIKCLSETEGQFLVSQDKKYHPCDTWLDQEEQGRCGWQRRSFGLLIKEALLAKKLYMETEDGQDFELIPAPTEDFHLHDPSCVPTSQELPYYRSLFTLDSATHGDMSFVLHRERGTGRIMRFGVQVSPRAVVQPPRAVPPPGVVVPPPAMNASTVNPDAAAVAVPDAGVALADAIQKMMNRLFDAAYDDKPLPEFGGSAQAQAHVAAAFTRGLDDDSDKFTTKFVMWYMARRPGPFNVDACSKFFIRHVQHNRTPS